MPGGVAVSVRNIEQFIRDTGTEVACGILGKFAKNLGVVWWPVWRVSEHFPVFFSAVVGLLSVPALNQLVYVLVFNVGRLISVPVHLNESAIPNWSYFTRSRLPGLKTD